MTYDVLIAGAGPVGLALAIELGLRGVSCLVVERNDRVGQSPRAKTTNVRSREHLRRWGIADTLRQASPIPPDYPPDIVFATRLNGPELARFHNAFNGCRVRNELYSEEAQWVPQYTVEEVLRARATALPGVSVVFNTELTRIEQDADGVSADVTDLATGATRGVRGRYLVGADGARSFVRECIGAKLQGDAPAMKNLSVIFRAPDIARRHAHGDALMYWMVNPDVPGVVGPMDQHGLWYFMATKLPGDIDPASLDPVDLVRRGTGLLDLEMEVIRIDPWIARSLVADFYASGRVFLAGDACHLHPPFGGFGMNMGIGDAVDLGWKLAATLQGWGGPALLDSYQTERRPVHERTISEAGINYAIVGNQLVRPAIEAAGPEGDAIRRQVGERILATKVREFSTLGLVLGARYDRSPIVVPDGTMPPPEHFSDYVPSACPGGLAPHQWLADGSSLYDHFGPGFTLLVAEPDPQATAALVTLAQARQIPLTVLAPGDARLGGLYAARFTLVRPDQMVAWRGDVLPTDPSALLERVTGFH
jgi:2-polyprenyl-6-methoxyphenol hydroxylase-like FAD-dependent oxidoreductase